MKSLLFCTLAFFCIYSVSAQKVFDNGYYIDNTGNRTDGYIRTVDFETINSDGAVLEFRNDPNGASTNIDVKNVTEAGIGKDIKFLKFTIELDNSDLYNNLGYNKYPDFKTVTVFLNVLTEGEASLFAYENNGGTKYFYSMKAKGDKPEQLVYKKYLYDRLKTARENTSFRQQLSDNVKCEGDSFSKFSTIKYDKIDLLPLFIAYNNCHNSQAQVFKNEKKKTSKTNFTLYAGVHSGILRVTGPDPEPGSESKTGFKAGGELELIGSTGKWGAIARIEIEHYAGKFVTNKDLSEFTDDVQTDTYDFKSSAFNLAIGARYHLNPEAKNKFYIDAAAAMDFPSGQVEHSVYITTVSGQFPGDDIENEAKPNFYMSFGVGYAFHEKIGIEMRADTGKKIVADSSDLSAVYSTIGLNLRYTFE